MILRYRNAAIICALLVCFTNCKKFVKTEAPYTSISSGNIYSTDATAASILTGIYANLSRDNTINFRNSFSSLSLLPSLSADELTLFYLNDQELLPYYRNSLLRNGLNLYYWNLIYPVVYSANVAIEGLTNSKGLTDSVKNQLIGEAKFVRAFCYFYLVNLYGDVPVALTSDYQVNSSLARSSKDDVYKQIINDLKDAELLLSDKYLKGDAFTSYNAGSEERLRPTKWAAAALLARTYLYTGDWVNAEAEATKVITNASLFGLEALINVFKKNNREAIWQLQPTSTGSRQNPGEGRFFILPSSGPEGNFPVYLSNNIMNGFEPGDQRKSSWVSSVTIGSMVYNYPFKYKIGSVNTPTQEYSTVIRLAEVYLIRSEARAQQNNISGAQSDINAVRTRAFVTPSPITASDKDSLLAAILHERQVELFTEWGHRWLDLKRTGNINAVMSVVTPAKGGTWNTNWQLYPIPEYELSHAPQLTQNAGY